MGKEKKSIRKTVLLAAGLAAVITIGGISAYFTDVDSAANVFTTGKVAIELKEPEYNARPEEHRNITPNKSLAKDPYVTNTGINDAFVFLEFTIPKATVKTANENGSQNVAINQELFAYGISEGWTQIVREDGEDGCRYVYAYGTKEACKPLAAGETTPVLFSGGAIRFINVIEGQGMEEETLELPVEAYGIQTVDIDGGKTAPEDIWPVLENQQTAG
ncbi:SipW-dependent-type signal peptide-containing protein [Anaerovorax odorimutans]|uniref:SipW-dependent-type signal peptide-containing protein n=1 Tax=Anaerovorax odorimutans TaxID=109327 RepID=A0ABT1RJI6_9FIRM|nr:SipW-dependent-type signal peptide-containing protein [Anaerovorax odorimutans]MCQ4635338.1 SipW-dependent-type signal peptide-containing protein [Anaerovorax odorimutans]